METNAVIDIWTVLFIVFLILKLCGVITWSWWWVTAPIWIPLGLSIIVALLVIFIFPDAFKEWWRKL